MGDIINWYKFRNCILGFIITSFSAWVLYHVKDDMIELRSMGAIFMVLLSSYFLAVIGKMLGEYLAMRRDDRFRNDDD